MKTIDDYFCDWEGDTFGFGYGTGEQYTIQAIMDFLINCNLGEHNAYEHETMSKILGHTVCWLLISVLARADIIEYGTSPRYGWLTTTGKRLRNYMKSKTCEELVMIVCSKNEDYTPCYRMACNCSPQGYVKGRICQNPFWCDNPQDMGEG